MGSQDGGNGTHTPGRAHPRVPDDRLSWADGFSAPTGIRPAHHRRSRTPSRCVRPQPGRSSPADIRALHASERLDVAVAEGAMTREEADGILQRLRGGEHSRKLRSHLAQFRPRRRSNDNSAPRHSTAVPGRTDRHGRTHWRLHWRRLLRPMVDQGASFRHFKPTHPVPNSLRSSATRWGWSCCGQWEAPLTRWNEGFSNIAAISRASEGFK